MPTMSNHQTFSVSADEANLRLDVFLSQELNITRSQAQKMIDNKQLSVNDKTARKTGVMVKEGDEIKIIEIPTKEPKDSKQNPPQASRPPADIKIIKKTCDYLVVEKPSGLLTHSNDAKDADSVAEILLKKYPEIKKIGDNPLRPGIVHRLDKDASGLLVVARTQEMFDNLKTQFKTRQVNKEYLVLVHGKVIKDCDEINFPIARSQTASRMAALPPTRHGHEAPLGKAALTEFIVEKRFAAFTLLRVKIHTGRMHQIRVHLLAYDHPVIGDPLYFQKKRKRYWDKRAGRLFLHCTKLVFKDLEGKDQPFESPLPTELDNFLKTLS